MAQQCFQGFFTQPKNTHSKPKSPMKKSMYLLVALFAFGTITSQITHSITIPDPIPEYDGTYEDFGRHHLYYPNSGEIRLDEEGGLQPSATDVVAYYTKFCFPQKFILHNSDMAFVYGRKGDSLGIADSLHRIDLEMFRSRAAAQPARIDTQLNCRLNYFLPFVTATDVMGGAAIAVQSIYTNIDMVYCSNNRGLKIFYVVYPGGNPNNILLKFNGAKSTEITAGNDLRIRSNFGDLTFVSPQMYQYTYIGNVVTPYIVCPASWSASGLGSDIYEITSSTPYDPNLPLIIQVSEGPALQPTANGIKWSTYFGGNLADNIFKSKNDAANNLYVAGNTIEANFPIFPGAVAYNTSVKFTYDAFISKFDPNGQLLWSAFMGSSGSDQINDFDFDVANGGDIYCVGTTGAAVDLPVLPKTGAFNGTPGGGFSDSFIFQLWPSGNICPWLTYVAGTGMDILQACKFDASGNFYAVGYSSSSDINALTGAAGSYQQAYNTAQQSPPGSDVFDAIILKFTANTSALNWFTWWGTSGTNHHDAFLGIDIVSSDVYVCGYADGNSIPGLLNTDFNNFSRDGVIVNFSTGGVLKGSRCTNGNKENNAIKVVNGKVYTCGYGNSAMQPVNSGAYYYDGTASANDAVFSVHAPDLLSTLHATFLGGSASENALDMAFAPNGVFYITGSTSSNNFPTVNLSNTWNSASNSGNTDYFLTAFVEGFSGMVWGTYLGSPNNETSIFLIYPNDGGASISIDGQGYLHLCGLSDSYTGFPLDNNGGPPTYFQPSRAGAPFTSSDITDGTITRFDLAAVNTFVGLRKLQGAPSLGLYPNPSTSYLTIDSPELKHQPLHYSIYNVTGQKMRDGLLPAGQDQQIDVRQLSSGVYIIRLTSGTQTYSSKFIKTDN
jgi:hypothetical protein